MILLNHISIHHIKTGRMKYESKKKKKKINKKKKKKKKN